MESLLRDLHSRKVDPTRHAGMILEVVKVNGTYYSNDNRRLNVLRDYMPDLGERSTFSVASSSGIAHTSGIWSGTSSEWAQATETRSASWYGRSENWHPLRHPIHLLRF